MKQTKDEGKALLTEALILTEVALDALTKERTNAYTAAYQLNAKRLALTTVLGAACALITIRSLSRMREAARQNHAWKAMDASLDTLLKETENSSEPTAVY